MPACRVLAYRSVTRGVSVCIMPCAADTFARARARALLPQGRHHLRSLLTRGQFLRGLLCTTVEAFDADVQVPAMGLASTSEYYESSSSRPLVPQIDVPTLVINAYDDPMVPPSAIPFGPLAANPNISTIFSTHGGHIGWHSGWTPLGRQWTDGVCVKFLLRQHERSSRPRMANEQVHAAERTLRSRL